MKPTSTTNVFRPLPMVTALIVTIVGVSAFAASQSKESAIAQTMGITQNLGKPIPQNLTFTDEDNQVVTLGSYLKGRPVLLVPIFYRCQTFCPVLTDSIMKTIAKAQGKDRLVVGKDFDVVMVSIHPGENAQLANGKKRLIISALTPPKPDANWLTRTSGNWHLLTGTRQNIDELVRSTLGIKFKYDARKDLINHPTCTVFVTPDGRISSYTIGNDFPTVVAERDIDVATANKIGKPADQSRMYGCIMLDPANQRYRPVVMNVMRVAGILTILGVAAFIFTLNIQSKRTPLDGGDSRTR